MKEKHVIDKFLEFEESNNLFDLEIKGINIWPYLRIQIYYKIINQKYDTGVAHSEFSYKQKILIYLKNLYYAIKKNPFLGLKPVDVLIFNHPRRVLNDNGYWESIYTDYLLKNSKKKYYVFEEPYQGLHLNPVYTKNLYYLDLIKRLTSLKLRIQKFFIRLSNCEKEQIESLQRNIEKEFELKLNDNFLKNYLSKQIPYIQSLKKYFKNLIEKTKPKFIIEVVSYGAQHMIINEIASKNNIKTIELQHGTMGKYHIAYNFLKKRQYSWFPDEIYLFGEFWKDNTRFPLENNKLKMLGYPYLNRMVKKYSNTQKSGEKNILFLSQGFIGKELSEFAVKLNKLIDKNNYKIIYKLHPGEFKHWKSSYKKLLNSSIKVIGNNDKNLYYYFAISDYQVGCFSTTIYEGLKFNLTTFIYKTYGHEFMEILYNNGYAHLIESENELLDKLNEDDHNEYDIEYFWAQNKQKTIDNIL